MSNVEQIRQEMMLYLLDLWVTPVCPKELARNFNVDSDRMREELECLAERGDVRRVGDDHYLLNGEGKRRVVVRSPAS